MKKIVQMIEHNIFIAERTLEKMAEDKADEATCTYVNGRKDAMEELKDFIERMPKGAA